MSEPPTFGSFPSADTQPQPSFNSFPAFQHDRPPQRDSRKDKHRSRDDQESSNHRHAHKKRKHESKSDRPKERHAAATSPARPSPSHHSTKSPAVLLLEGQLTVYPRRSRPTSSTPITSDTAGDPDFTRYGYLSSSDVPKFRRLGAGHVLGAAPGLRIMKAQQGSRRALTLLPSNQASLSRYTDRSQARKLLARTTKIYQLIPNKVPPPDTEFASSSTQAPIVRLLDEDLVDRQPQDPLVEPEYRDLGDAPSASGSDSDDGSEEDDPNNPSVLGKGRSYLDQLTLTNANRSAQVRADPQDVQAWLDFVAHQDVFLSNTRADFGLESDQTGSTAAGASRSGKRASREREERRAIAETKLDILAKALSKNKDAVDLVRERLRVGQVLWTAPELHKEWDRALRKADQGPSNVLWKDWVDWRASDARGFTVKDSLVQAAEEALRHLNSFQHRLSVFDKVVRCLRASAYPERAHAAYQALIEQHFFCPSHLVGASLDEKLDELEQFWESEVPRFGTNGAVGWCNSDSEAGPSPPADLTGLTSLSKIAATEDSGGFGIWAVQELKEAAQHRYTGSLLDLDEENMSDEDVYKVVMFSSDLRPLLFDLEGDPHVQRQSQQDLLFAYLAFLGFETLKPGQSTQYRASIDDVLSQNTASRFFPHISKGLNFEIIGGEPMEAARQSGLKNPAAGWGRHWPAMHELLLPSVDPGWPSYWQHQDWDSVDLGLLRASLEQILSRCTLDEVTIRFLRVYWFSIEAAYEPKSAAKLAKSWLAADQQQLLLWDAFARLEASRGKFKEAQTVYTQTASALHTFPQAQQDAAPIFWHGWADLEWQSGSKDRCLQVLAASVATAPTRVHSFLATLSLDAAQIAHTQREFESRLRSLRQGSLDNAHAVVANAALFTYLTKGLKAACALYEECCYDAKPVPAFQERLYVMYTKLVYSHTKQAAYQPGLMRDVLIDALAPFPTNSLFLNLYFHNESRTRIQNRVRALLDRQLSGSQAQVAESWIFRLFVELHLDARSYNAQAVQYIFEQAVTALQSRPSVAVWQLFLQFAILQKHPALIKSVLLRAVQECPTAKELYLLAFYGAGKTAFARRELKELHESMKETGLRLFTPVEPLLDIDDLQFGLPDDEPELEDDGVDEALRNLADKRKLMPW